MSKALKLKTGCVRELAIAFQEKYENCDILLLDDVQLLEHAQATQERLAILIKHLRSMGKQVVLSCDRHPSQFNRLEPGARPAERKQGADMIPCISAKLLAPLESCVAVGLDEPDLSTRIKLIQKKSMNIPFVDKDREEICRFLSIPPPLHGGIDPTSIRLGRSKSIRVDIRDGRHQDNRKGAAVEGI
jgi:chromosomal replication initiator protein